MTEVIKRRKLNGAAKTCFVVKQPAALKLLPSYGALLKKCLARDSVFQIWQALPAEFQNRLPKELSWRQRAGLLLGPQESGWTFEYYQKEVSNVMQSMCAKTMTPAEEDSTERSDDGHQQSSKSKSVPKRKTGVIFSSENKITSIQKDVSDKDAQQFVKSKLVPNKRPSIIISTKNEIMQEGIQPSAKSKPRLNRMPNTTANVKKESKGRTCSVKREALKKNDDESHERATTAMSSCSENHGVKRKASKQKDDESHEGAATAVALCSENLGVKRKALKETDNESHELAAKAMSSFSESSGVLKRSLSFETKALKKKNGESNDQAVTAMREFFLKHDEGLASNSGEDMQMDPSVVKSLQFKVSGGQSDELRSRVQGTYSFIASHNGMPMFANKSCESVIICWASESKDVPNKGRWCFWCKEQERFLGESNEKDVELPPQSGWHFYQFCAGRLANADNVDKTVTVHIDFEEPESNLAAKRLACLQGIKSILLKRCLLCSHKGELLYQWQRLPETSRKRVEKELSWQQRNGIILQRGTGWSVQYYQKEVARVMRDTSAKWTEEDCEGVVMEVDAVVFISGWKSRPEEVWLATVRQVKPVLVELQKSAANPTALACNTVATTERNGPLPGEAYQLIPKIQEGKMYFEARNVMFDGDLKVETVRVCCVARGIQEIDALGLRVPVWASPDQLTADDDPEGNGPNLDFWDLSLIGQNTTVSTGPVPPSRPDSLIWLPLRSQPLEPGFKPEFGIVPGLYIAKGMLNEEECNALLQHGELLYKKVLQTDRKGGRAGTRSSAHYLIVDGETDNGRTHVACQPVNGVPKNAAQCLTSTAVYRGSHPNEWPKADCHSAAAQKAFEQIEQRVLQDVPEAYGLSCGYHQLARLLPKTDISPHWDRKLYGPVIMTVVLQASVEPNEHDLILGNQRVPLSPGDAYVLVNEARNVVKHSITPARSVIRWAITSRFY